MLSPEKPKLRYKQQTHCSFFFPHLKVWSGFHSSEDLEIAFPRGKNGWIRDWKIMEDLFLRLAPVRGREERQRKRAKLNIEFEELRATV